MIRLWAGWFTATLARLPGPGRGTGRCWSCWTARAAATPGSRPTAPAACSTAPAPAGSRSGRTRPGCACGTCRPDELAVLLYQMIDTGTGAAAYYADILQAVVTLAVAAPVRPAAEHRQRSWTGSNAGLAAKPPGATACTRPRPSTPAPRPGTCRDIQLRYATLLGRLGPALDGPGRLDEADAWYCILEGTREPSVAEAQAMALTELAAHAATSPGQRAAGDAAGRRRLQRRVRPGAAVATCTSGAGPWASACRSRPSPGRGSGATRMSGTGSRPPPTAASSCCTPPTRSRWWRWPGTRRVLETAHKLIGDAWGDEGTTREQHAWTADPDLIRRLDVGQACLHPPRRGHLRPGRPAQAVPAHPAAPARPPAPPGASARAPPRTRPPTPDRPGRGRAGLDDIFGPGDRP